MLAAGQDADVEVSWEDQKMINTFGRLTSRRQEIDVEVKGLEQTIASLEEAQTDIIMADDKFPYRLGDGFVVLSKEDAETRLTAEADEARRKKVELEAQRTEIVSTLSSLKVKLYAKFKSQINLEE